MNSSDSNIKVSATSAASKALIITYYWPPSGGAGVQRWLKFVKYLPSTGWIPFVLTVRTQDATYPFRDETLENEIQSDVKVIRTKATNYFSFYSKDPSKIPSGGFANNPGKGLKNKISRFIRGNFFIPDPRRGWNKYAFKAAIELIAREGITHIITTSPPHSSQLIGLRLKKRFPSVVWIADLRDLWTDIYYYKLFYPTIISKSIDRQYERKVIHMADHIITVGQNLASSFASNLKETTDKISIIPNGYDEDDFNGVVKLLPERFTLTYAGTISDIYPIDSLLDAINKVHDSGRDLLLRFVGSVPDDIKSKIVSKTGTDRTEFIPYSEHSVAIELMARSSLLVLIIPDHIKNNAITPGKVFEYLASAKPVLYIGPEDGDAAYHLRQCGHTGIFNDNDTVKIAEFIISMMTDKPQIFRDHPEYSRRELTKQLTHILNTVKSRTINTTDH